MNQGMSKLKSLSKTISINNVITRKNGEENKKRDSKFLKATEFANSIYTYIL